MGHSLCTAGVIDAIAKQSMLVILLPVASLSRADSGLHRVKPWAGQGHRSKVVARSPSTLCGIRRQMGKFDPRSGTRSGSRTRMGPWTPSRSPPRNIAVNRADIIDKCFPVASRHFREQGVVPLNITPVEPPRRKWILETPSMLDR